MGRTTICSSGWDSPPLATCFLWALLEESKQRKGFVAVFGWLAVFFSGDKPGFGPAAELLSLALLEESKQRKGFVAVFGWLAVSRSGDKPGFGPAAELLSFASPKESNQRKGFVAVFGWLAVSRSGDKPGFGPAAELLSFASPKESNQRKGEPRPCRFAVPCATRSVRGRAKLASLRQRPPLSERCSVAQHGLMAGGYLTARPLRGPRPNGLFAALTSRSWVASFLTPHFSQGHGTPCHYSSLLFPHSSPLTSHHGQPQGLPLRPLKTDAEPKLRHSALDAESGHTTPTAPRAKTPPHSPHHFSRFASLAQASMSAALLTIAPHRPPTPACNVSAANEPFGRSSRSGRAERYPPPLGRAEQRSSVRIKALALFERSEFASVPNAASSARNPKGTDVARLFFGYFFLAKQKKVTRPPGRDPASSRSETQSAQQKTKKNLSLPTSPQQRQ